MCLVRVPSVPRYGVTFPPGGKGPRKRVEEEKKVSCEALGVMLTEKKREREREREEEEEEKRRTEGSERCSSGKRQKNHDPSIGTIARWLISLTSESAKNPALRSTRVTFRVTPGQSSRVERYSLAL